MKERYCRICGLYILNPPWGKNQNNPTYEICPCCGVEFGNEDYSLESLRQYRQEWLKDGAVWFESNEKPVSWNLEEQIKNVPDDFY